MGPFELRYNSLRLKLPEDVDEQYLQQGADREFIFEQLLKTYDNTKHLLPDSEGEQRAREAQMFGWVGLALFGITVIMFVSALLSVGVFAPK